MTTEMSIEARRQIIAALMRFNTPHGTVTAAAVHDQAVVRALLRIR